MLSTKDLNDLYQIFIIIEQNNAAGLSIPEALSLYASRCKRPKVKKILQSVLRDISNGISLPNALSKHTDFFPDYIVEMVRVCGATGQSARIYKDLVKTLEKEVDMRRSLGSQVGQAIFMLVLLCITIGLVIFLVLPSMGSMMSSLDMDIPVYTQILIGIGKFGEDYWWLMLIALFAAGGGVRAMMKRSPEKVALILLRIPLYSPIVYYTLQYRFALIFGLCKDAGLETILALKYTGSGSDNILMRNLLNKVIKEIDRGGKSLAEAFQKHDEHKIIDESFLMFLKAGEQSDIVKLMNVRAEFYAKEIITAADSFSRNLSNMLMTPTFAILGLIVVSVLAPMFSMMFQMSSGQMGG